MSDVDKAGLEVRAHDIVVAKVEDHVVVVVDGNIAVDTQDFSPSHLERIMEALGLDFADELVVSEESAS